MTTAGKRVEKTRYAIPYGKHIIELDIYEGNLAGLVTAEVEFDSEAAAQDFKPPEWFSTDVTGESDFKNQNLALHGLPGLRGIDSRYRQPFLLAKALSTKTQKNKATKN